MKPTVIPVVQDTDAIIDQVLVEADKLFGEGLMRLDSPLVRSTVSDYISTQCSVLDHALGVPGVPVGRLTEIFGPEAGGKSTLSAHILAETQRRNGISVLLDTENAFDIKWARKLGVNTKQLIIDQPDCMESVYSKIRGLTSIIKEKDPNRLLTIVWDSVASTPTKAELEDNAGLAEQARVNSRELRTIIPLIAKQKVCLVFINQIRDKVGVTYGDHSTTPAGKAIGFYASIRMAISRIGTEKDSSGVPSSAKCQVTIKKNKCAPPFRVANFCINFKKGGIDNELSLLDTANDLGIVVQKGAWQNLDIQDPESKSQITEKFYAKNWHDVLVKYPWLENHIKQRMEFE